MIKIILIKPKIVEQDKKKEIKQIMVNWMINLLIIIYCQIYYLCLIKHQFPGCLNIVYNFEYYNSIFDLHCIWWRRNSSHHKITFTTDLKLNYNFCGHFSILSPLYVLLSNTYSPLCLSCILKKKTSYKHVRKQFLQQFVMYLQLQLVISI